LWPISIRLTPRVNGEILASDLSIYVVALGVVALSVLGAWVAYVNSDNPVISIVVAGIITLISLLYAVEKVKADGQTTD